MKGASSNLFERSVSVNCYCSQKIVSGKLLDQFKRTGNLLSNFPEQAYKVFENFEDLEANYYH